MRNSSLLDISEFDSLSKFETSLDCIRELLQICDKVYIIISDKIDIGVQWPPGFFTVVLCIHLLLIDLLMRPPVMILNFRSEIDRCWKFWNIKKTIKQRWKKSWSKCELALRLKHWWKETAQNVSRQCCQCSIALFMLCQQHLVTLSACSNLLRTQCKIEFTYASHCVSKNMTPRRMFKTYQITGLAGGVREGQNMAQNGPHLYTFLALEPSRGP